MDGGLLATAGGIKGPSSSLAARVVRATRPDGAWIVPVAAFLVALWRAATLSIGHDEALTVLGFVPLGYGTIFGLVPTNANNHPLNTALIKMTIQVFGLHELTVRAPALLGHALYLGCVVGLIRKHVPRHRALATGLLSSHPLLVDLFSAGRGYGLGLGWLLAAVWSADQARTVGGVAWPRWNAVAAGAGALASLSNLSFLPGHLGVLAGIAIVELARGKRVGAGRSERSRAWALRTPIALAVLSGVPVLAVYGRSLAPGVASQVFYVGGTQGFWPDTVSSLVEATMYAPVDASGVLLLGQATIAASVMLGAMVLAARVRSELTRPEAWTWWTAPMVALISGSMTTTLAHHVVGVPYPTDRTAVFLVPLYLLTLIGLWQWAASPARRRRRFLAFVFTGLVIGLTGWHISRWQVRYHVTWPYDARTRDAVDVIRADLATRAWPAGQPIRVGADWVFEPSLNFYRLKYRLPIEPIRRASVRAAYDYYYVLATSSWAGQAAHAREIQRAFDLVELAYFPDVDAYVLRR